MLQLHKIIFVTFQFIYSYLPNKRGGSNKRGGWKFSNQLINREGEKVPNKRGGWTFSGKLIKGESRKNLK